MTQKAALADFDALWDAIRTINSKVEVSDAELNAMVNNEPSEGWINHPRTTATMLLYDLRNKYEKPQSPLGSETPSPTNHQQESGTEAAPEQGDC